MTVAEGDMERRESACDTDVLLRELSDAPDRPADVAVRFGGAVKTDRGIDPEKEATRGVLTEVTIRHGSPVALPATAFGAGMTDTGGDGLDKIDMGSGGGVVPKATRGDESEARA